MKNIAIDLTKSEEVYLRTFLKRGKSKAKSYQRASILLHLHREVSYDFLTHAFSLSRSTIWHLKKKYQELGIKRSLEDRPRSGQPKKYHEKQDQKSLLLLVLLLLWEEVDGHLNY